MSTIENWKISQCNFFVLNESDNFEMSCEMLQRKTTHPDTCNCCTPPRKARCCFIWNFGEFHMPTNFKLFELFMIVWFDHCTFQAWLIFLKLVLKHFCAKTSTCSRNKPNLNNHHHLKIFLYFYSKRYGKGVNMCYVYILFTAFGTKCRLKFLYQLAFQLSEQILFFT